MGNSLPDGGELQVTQVEMCVDSDDYLPDSRDVQLTGKKINNRSGGHGISDHATIVGRYYLGQMSIASGVLRMDSYEANNWAGFGLLQVATGRLPRTETSPIQNHSWIGSFGSSSLDSDTLRRVDYMVERDGVLVTAGVKNGAGTPVPELVCSAYNVLAVGVSNGRSSYGPTRFETSGRIKPDIVAPLDATSWATPVVGSSGSLLIQAIHTARALDFVNESRRLAARPLLVKALLMGGATKDEWSDWHRGFANTKGNDPRVPLDYRYGAGELNIDNSYRILTAGRQSSGRVGLTGWDVAMAVPGQAQRYAFEVAQGDRVRTASFLVAWHRRITPGSGDPIALTPSLADINLRLYRQTAEGYELVDASLSAVDNVEHIFQRDLRPGNYVLEVSTDRNWMYALTWDVQTGENLPFRETTAPILAEASPTPGAEHVTAAVATEAPRIVRTAE